MACTCAFPCGGTDCGPDTTGAYIAKLEAELKKVKADRKSCWAEFKVMTRSCLAAEKKLAEAEQQLLDTQHELAILHDTYKLYPGEWCCNAARFSNGWNHAESCKNWVLKF